MSLLSPKLKADSDTGGTRKLQEVGQAMGSIATRNDLADFLKNPENAQRVDDLVEDIHYALMDYQVCSTPQAHPHHL